MKEMKEIIQKIFEEKYEGEKRENYNTYLLRYEGNESIVIIHKKQPIGIQYNPDGEMVALQPLKFLEEECEKL